MGKTPGHREYDKICNGLKALSEILSIHSYIINANSLFSLDMARKHRGLVVELWTLNQGSNPTEAG